MLRNTALIALTTLALGALWACGDDTGGTTSPGLDTAFGDTPVGSDTYTPPSDTSNPQAVRRLEFEKAFGDDQVACRGTDRCTISISYTERRTLKVIYTEDGAPTGGQVVKFALEADNDGVGFLNTLSSVTEPSTGLAQVETKARDAHIGQFVVKAWIDNSPVPPLYFDVVVTPKGQVPLTVIGSYAGARPVGSYNVRLYRQDASNKPDCTDLLDLYDNQTAAQARDNIQLTQSAKFPQFDSLEADGTQTYTVLAYSTNQNDAIQAWGCNAADAVITWGGSTTVQVEMVDRPPIYAGAYDIVSRFDFISAIPEPYKTWVDYIVGFFQDPTGTILELACDLLTADGEDLNSFCDLIFDTDASGDLVLTTIGGFAADLLNGIIQSISEDSVFGTIFQVGGDVADILKAFEINATLTFNVEPNAAGEWVEGDTAENWHTVKVKWSLGANCDPDTDENCGVRQFSINAFQTEAITGTFSASVANFFDLTIDKHPLNLHYGALINYFLEKFLIPLVTGQDVVDTYEELIGYLVGGDVACLTDGGGPNHDLDCCESFADKVAPGSNGDNGVVDGGTEGALKAACATILTAGSSYLRHALTNLDVDSGDTFTIGTLESCKLSDFNNDMIVDGVGTKAKPCKWDVTLKVGSTESTFDAIFWGGRQE